MKPAVKNILWHHLNDAGAFPDTDFYCRSISLVNSEGQGELDGLHARLQSSFFKQSIDKVCPKLNSLDLIRVLGFGRFLSTYFLSPLRLPFEFQEPLVRLGALANLIVTLFDHLLDRGYGNGLVNEQWLYFTKRKTVLGNFRQMLFSKSVHQNLMYLLIQFYFQDVEKIVGSTNNIDGKRTALYLQEVIRVMYTVELKTVNSNQGLQAPGWRKKSALPFITMGLPGWIVKKRDDEFRRWHLRWIYQAGFLLGSIDDAIDFQHDLDTNSYNVFSSRKIEGAEIKASCNDLCLLLKRLKNEWQQHALEEHIANPFIAGILNLTICSWFGGPYWQPLKDSQDDSPANRF